MVDSSGSLQVAEVLSLESRQASDPQATKKPVCRDQGHLDKRGCSLAITQMGEWGGHAGASARRLQLRVTTPLASTAIIHLLTSFQKLRFDDARPGANQNGPVVVRKGSLATRYREPTTPLFLQAPDRAREKRRCRSRRTAASAPGFTSCREKTAKMHLNSAWNRRPDSGLRTQDSGLRLPGDRSRRAQSPKCPPRQRSSADRWWH
jgi:hypothetical protein